jgi:rhodanese-related sulfurtransferase
MKEHRHIVQGAALTVLVLIAVSGCWAAQDAMNPGIGDAGLPPYGLVTTQQAAGLIETLHDTDEFVLLDIRTPDEVEASHISGAINIDYYADSFREELSSLDRDRIYLIYCRTGNRTGRAYTLMEELGFEKVYDMEGGISQWIAGGYAICSGALDAEHTCMGAWAPSPAT